MQPSNKVVQKVASDLVSKFCEIADVFDEDTLNDELIEVDDASTCHTFRRYWARNLMVHVALTTTQAKWLQKIQKDAFFQRRLT